jgi:hypothetical protein
MIYWIIIPIFLIITVIVIYTIVVYFINRNKNAYRYYFDTKHYIVERYIYDNGSFNSEDHKWKWNSVLSCETEENAISYINKKLNEKKRVLTQEEFIEQQKKSAKHFK